MDLRATRAAIAEGDRLPEPICVPPLVEAARLPSELDAPVRELTMRLVRQLRGERSRASGVDALMREFSLSSQEGVALMCLAEALLRIPDTENRDRLIRDKLAGADWRAHLGASPSLFVNAASWGLLVTGRLVATNSERGLSASLSRLVARGGEPLIRAGLDLAMRLLGRQFVLGRNIAEALDHARPMEAKGFRYSFDMLGEAAMTARDAERYTAQYRAAIEAIGAAGRGRGVYAGPGISVKLSALHPRYSYTQPGRLREELLPRLRGLALAAARHDIGFNIDAEEADRLEPSLDLLEALATDPELAGWQGLGFVVQAYQKRAPAVIRHVIALARQYRRRIMIRLVKGAYWDSEIKRAQVDGLAGFPVFTRKAYTDVSYIACAKLLLEARADVFPQFATHNAQTLSAIFHLADGDFREGDWEFQCLHGMGEGLYGQVVGADRLDRPCRIYAPVGSHETLLAYLVRRLLENGANSSFVHRLVDDGVPIDALAEDPVPEAEGLGGAPHPRVALPADIFGDRRNSTGSDLSSPPVLKAMQVAIEASRVIGFTAGDKAWPGRPVLNPADRRDQVGLVHEAPPEAVPQTLARAEAIAPDWAARPADARADILERAADLFEARRDTFVPLAIREAGKTMANAIGELREAVDFLRYYAAQARALPGTPLGPVVCISPWNFPLAIFTGQVAAALAAGNTVIAKPAEQTPLIAAEAVRLLHEAGIPPDVLQLLPGDGASIGGGLVADPRCQGVVFTGSTEVARLLQRSLSTRGDVPLIAETGGQNAMIVDSSALAEQVVADVLASAFDSAGQRCSALRVLCLQEEVAPHILEMLEGAMRELVIGDPSRIETDLGPVIDVEAEANLRGHLARHPARLTLPLSADAAQGSFVPPSLIEIGSVAELGREVFGPVLHVLRFDRERLGELVQALNATGYGLTLGVHSRIDETIDFVVERAHVGNAYVNRNIIGAVVGAQPFGGEGLSGTGPKAGGPLYLRRLMRAGPVPCLEGVRDEGVLEAFDRLAALPEAAPLAELLAELRSASPLPANLTLPGPVGETNTLRFAGRGKVLVLAGDLSGLLTGVAAAWASGNTALAPSGSLAEALNALLPDGLRIGVVEDWRLADCAAVLALTDGQAEEARKTFAFREGALIPVIDRVEPAALLRLVAERTLSVNEAAAGGNAALMTI
ncbi:bifunctional proline dehydrogenase/L-glutamate gamma-semialdehyde dehydrogenase PutA [Roseococcus pinisoli]|uniref:Bifunctional protein PutA n=1 Tax=Roseococcus pinisoli TaxID=2835040 RepID=A0ABS5QHE6_9PROT|nr:bifunctional proline dehydrogenase/L-glutamate gamma-semialdehyde dehydrogenase PutA [Roseococcus pinisoli]MBS7811968.1 bifunctional proline dehydrogenase/L-glutamate gamma-semialdehyde dehydrogenase PutA [Roseococcus pinisoli]